MDDEAGAATGAETGSVAGTSPAIVGAGEAAIAAATGNGTGTGGEGKTEVESLFSHLENSDSPAALEPGAQTGASGAAGEAGAGKKEGEGGGEAEGAAGTGKTGEGGAEGEAAPTTVDIRGKAYDLGGINTLYQESSREGTRLNNTLGLKDDHIVALDLEIAELQEKAANVTFTEKTDEQLEALSSLEQNRYLHSKSEHERRASDAKRNIEDKKVKLENGVQERKEFIIDKMHSMASDSVRYPDYRDLVPIMKEVESIAPFVMGEKNTPVILYFAALGMKEWRAREAGAEAKAGAETTAGAAATATAARVGSTGKLGTTQGDGTKIDPDSDMAVGNAILATRRPNILAGLGQD